MLDVFFMMSVTMIQKLIRILLIMNKAKVVKLVLTIVKYGITLILGYLGGSEDIINQVSNL